MSVCKCSLGVYRNATLQAPIKGCSNRAYLRFMIHPMRKVIKPIATPKRNRIPPGQRVGYVRVSALDQNPQRQLERVKVDRTFEEKASGKSVLRPQLEAMLAFVREGDTVVCHSMDRLGRNLDDLRKLVLGLTERGVMVQFIKENLLFSGEDSPMANLLLSVMGAFAQFERELIRERQREGIALAKRAGKYRGRTRALAPAQVAELRRLAKDGASKTALARKFGIHRTSVYRYL
jgi:DNA invertase Pin-like site-specific DNA recombinase